MSPDELSNEQLLDNIAAMRRWIEEGSLSEYDEKYYTRRAERYEGILKERAEDGTYAQH